MVLGTGRVVVDSWSKQAADMTVAGKQLALVEGSCS